MRGGLYAASFLLIALALGLIASWWALLALPVALLIGLTFGNLLLGLGLSWLLAGLIERPVRELETASRRLALGELDVADDGLLDSVTRVRAESASSADGVISRYPRGVGWLTSIASICSPQTSLAPCLAQAFISPCGQT